MKINKWKYTGIDKTKGTPSSDRIDNNWLIYYYVFVINFIWQNVGTQYDNVFFSLEYNVSLQKW